MPDLFKGIIPSITTTKQYLDDIDGYNAYVVNISLANHIDCVLYANEMNQYSGLTTQMQYDYYFHSVRKAKRPFSYEKKIKNDDMVSIKEWYQCSNSKAKEILRILTPEQVKTIVKLTEKGGK